FDLDSLRKSANWLAGDTSGTPNITPRPTPVGTLKALEPKTYGTLTMQQFLENVRDGKTMYGVVRVTVGLEKGTCAPSCKADAKNGVGEKVDESTLYGFCGAGTTGGLCACAPSDRIGRAAGHHFDAITPQSELCVDSSGVPIVLPKEAKIMVKGSLLWDFVDYSAKDESGQPITIPLASLPFFPRELYFMVDVPIIINSAYEKDYCGGKHYAECVAAVSKAFKDQIKDIRDAVGHVASTTVTKPYNKDNGIDLVKIPQTSRDLYAYMRKETLDDAKLKALDAADQFHLMVPSGYTKGWADAFSHLQLTASAWQGLNHKVPSGAPGGSPLTEEWIRDKDFEDIPVYLYSGGLVDMHNHVNVSGLIYVPQALELEAEVEKDIRQLVAGAIIVRDGFYLKAKNNSILVVSSEPGSYSSVRTLTKIPKMVHLRSGLG
ncbi:MAG: hypothetical protein FD130_2641, partial [Halothiobacillaceae bacterium]